MKRILLLPWLLATLAGCSLHARKPVSYIDYAKRPVSYAGMVLGSIESPIVLAFSQLPLPTPYTRLNKPLAAEVCDALGRMDRTWTSSAVGATTGTLIQSRQAAADAQRLAFDEHGETFDTFSDLSDERPLVLVALSGGGLRATRLAAHTMRELEEEYNRLSPDYLQRPAPMSTQIDAISSVSGGSIYSALAARRYAHKMNTLLPRPISQPLNYGLHQLPFLHSDEEQRPYRFFRELEQSSTVLWRTRSLGVYACFTYLTPFTIPFYFLTDYGYAHHLAMTLDFYPDLLPFTFTFSDLPRTAPRFFFCATGTATGAPFVFTQHMVHLPSERVLELPTAQEDLLLVGYAPPKPARKLYPLFNALTLEDLNSSPARFPISMAAMTSAAFPGMLDPVALCTYGYSQDKKKVYQARQKMMLFDGGVYDNSGLMTLADLVEYLALNRPEAAATPSATQPVKPKVVMLLSVNAEITRFDPNVVKREAWRPVLSPVDSLNLFSLRPLWPFSALKNGITAINQVHFSNKKRAEELAVGRLRTLERRGLIKFYYFPVNLTELESIKDGGKTTVTFEQVQKISTALDLRADEDETLKRAAHLLLSKERQGYEPLALNDDSHLSTAQAWATALIRLQLNLWQGPPQRIQRPED